MKIDTKTISKVLTITGLVLIFAVGLDIIKVKRAAKARI